MNLFEIDARIMEALEAAVDMETGEIVNMTAYEMLNGLQMAFEQKAENVLLLIKNLTAEAEALKKQKQTFADRQSAAEKKVESLKQYISKALDGKPFKTERVSASWRKSESVEYTGDIMALPDAFIRMKAPELNKDALKKYLKDGNKVDGAVLVQKQNIQIK